MSTLNQIQELPETLIIDEYKNSKSLFKFPILTDLEREELSIVEVKINDFEDIIKKSITNKAKMFCNGLILTGDPGTGKTHNILKWLFELLEDQIIDKYLPFSGKISPITLFQLMKANAGFRDITVLDDSDVWDNLDSMNILKAALDTGMGKKRFVSYGSRGNIDKFEYGGFLIVITNHKFENPNDHVKAVLDRTHLMKLNMTRRDIYIKNTSIVEDFVNSKEANLPEDLIKDVIEFYKTDIKDFFDYDCFAKCNINFSVRFIMKAVDLFNNFGSKWKNFSSEYKKLNDKLQQERGVQDFARLKAAAIS